MNARLVRRKRTCEDVGIKSSGGMFDLFDNAIKEFLRINDEEYDFLIENATDSELDLLLKQEFTYGEQKEIIRILDKHLSLMHV
jgi:hypothetical protein